MTDSFFQFYSPLAFMLIPFAIFLFIFELKKKKFLCFPFNTKALTQNRKISWRLRFEFVPAFLKFLSLILIIITLARPQLGNQFTEVTSEGVDMILTLDTSESMRALDMELDGLQADRLQAVKSVVTEFIKGRKYDRMGMVVFGEEAYTQCPLTLDYDILLGYLDLIEIGIAGDATALGNALAMSVKRLLKSNAKSRVIILLTDGESNAGEVSPEIAAELAKENGIKVYTIAVGTKGGRVPFPVKNSFGLTRIQYVQLDVDEEILKKISEMTNAKFFSADSTETLQGIYAEIDRLEKTQVKIDQFTEFEEYYPYFLYLALILLLISWLLKHFVFLRIP